MEKKFKTFFTFREYGDCKAKNEEQQENFDNDGNPRDFNHPGNRQELYSRSLRGMRLENPGLGARSERSRFADIGNGKSNPE